MGSRVHAIQLYAQKALSIVMTMLVAVRRKTIGHGVVAVALYQSNHSNNRMQQAIATKA